MKHLLWLLLLASPLFARDNYTGNCATGNTQVVVQGKKSSNKVVGSFPSCTVSVYLTGTLTLATIYSDNAGTAKANPFTALVNGAYIFYADDGRYDVTMSSGGFPQPVTISDILFFDGAVASGISSINSLTGALTINSGTAGTDFAVASSGTTITLNLPTASASNRGALSAADWTAFNAKGAATSFTAPLVNTAGTVALTLPMTIGQGGTGQITQGAAFTALSPQTTKGDIIAYSTLPLRLGVGTDGYVLSADSAQATGLRWVPQTGGGAGNPGGISTQMQVNSSGAFAGTAGMTWDSTNPGLSLSLVNPTQGADANERRAAHFTCTYGDPSSTPTFADQNCFEIAQVNLQGQNSYGGGTNAKTSFIPLNVSTTNYAAGQRFSYIFNTTCYGMGDCATTGNSGVTFAGADVAGDEGQGFELVRALGQQNHLTATTISSVPTRNTCNTTITQNITASLTAQTVTVASSTGCAGWVVLGHAAASSTPNAEAVNITNAGAGTLTGIFLNNHTSGDSVLPGTVMSVASINEFGQQRVLVNLSGTTYTTGTVMTVSSATFTGSGTTWTTGMVGGDATNPGCISLTNDNVTLPSTETLRSWYEISSRASNTSINIFTTSVANDGAYRGNGVGAGAYVIRPCARILYLVSSAGSLTGQIVLDYNTFTWTNGNSVEAIISPYPDVTGYQERIATYSPGGTYRRFWNIGNSGKQKFAGGYYIETGSFAGSGSSFASAFEVGGNGQVDVGLNLIGVQTHTSAITLPAPTAGNGACIMWGPGACSAGRFIGPTVDGMGVDTNSLQIAFINSGSAATLSGTQVGTRGAFDFSGGTINLHEDSGGITNGPSVRIANSTHAAILQNTNGSLSADRTIEFPDRAGTLGVFGNATTGASTETFTNSPCTMAPTVPQWIPVTVTGLSGTYYLSVCH